MKLIAQDAFSSIRLECSSTGQSVCLQGMTSEIVFLKGEIVRSTDSREWILGKTLLIEGSLRIAQAD